MGFFETSTSGIKETSILLRDLEKDVGGGMKRRLAEASQLVVAAAKEETHSRRVAAAMSYDVNVKSATDFWARMGPSRKKAWFAHFLEFGTVHSRKFPFLAPALKRTQEQVVEIVGFPPILRSPGGGRGAPILSRGAA